MTPQLLITGLFAVVVLATLVQVGMLVRVAAAKIPVTDRPVRRRR